MIKINTIKLYLAATFFGLFLTSAAMAFVEFHVGPLTSWQPENRPKACSIYHHKYQLHSSAGTILITWDGKCKDGFAEGKGMIEVFVNSELVEIELVELIQGKREGQSIQRNAHLHDADKYFVTVEEYKKGYVCGNGAEYDQDNYRFVAYRGDCNGLMEQTSNPFDYFLQQSAEIDGSLAAIFKVLMYWNRDVSKTKANCLASFKIAGFSDFVSGRWCTLTW